MGCISSTSINNNKYRVTKRPLKFNQTELDLLQLMYDNLAKRCRNNLVTRQTFQIFFHASGLMGEIIFTKFDSKKNGTISIEELLQAFELMTKGTLRERADVLFSIYDVNSSGGVRFQELLKILFSYTPQELNKMFSEEKFLKYIGDAQLIYYFGAEHKKIEEKMILEEDSEEEKDTKKKTDFVPGSLVLAKVSTDMNGDGNAKNQEKQVNKRLAFDPKGPLFTKKKNQKKQQKKGISSSVMGMTGKHSKTNLKVKSNIASLTRKYANYLFSSYNLNKDTDVFSKQNFYSLIQEHTSLFNVYLSGFHTYIWQVQNGTPQFLTAEPWIEGQAQEVFRDKDESVYLKYIRTTIFVLIHKKAKMPREIINLQGLTVDVLQKRKGKDAYGIVFKHRDGLYSAKQYYFQNKQKQDEWVKLLSQFRSSSLQDQYLKLERIGGGNFSNVFRGKSKQSGQQVAIKVIETYKLSLSEKEVLKRQTGILKQCHHQNIIKFINQFKTKSHIYILTEICTEGDLFTYTKKNGFLQEYQAAVILKQLVDAILYLNVELGIVHRDLKPENVLIKMNQDKTSVKRIKLIDFGFGVFKDKIKQLPIKQKFAGTPGFIAPEIYKQEQYDEKIDTFSLGIILYFMLSGKFPFHSDFLEEIEDLTKTCCISMVNNHWANVSDQAKQLIEKILCFKEIRISTKEVSEHRWLQNIQNLKSYRGSNIKKARAMNDD